MSLYVLKSWDDFKRAAETSERILFSITTPGTNPETSQVVLATSQFAWRERNASEKLVREILAFLEDGNRGVEVLEVADIERVFR